ncbi:MAG: hypothetical protein M1339_03545 [Bacteroidetes bacterium]|nr:hypothetical protein [Bacteroidota bacterium]
MNIIDKALYLQIHPFKLATDVIAAFVAVYLLWINLLIPGLVVAFVPSLVISFFMIRVMDLEKEKRSKLGKYVKKYMGRAADTARSIGFVGMLAGGWFHFVWLIALGFVVVLLSWLNGLILKRETAPQTLPHKMRK